MSKPLRILTLGHSYIVGMNRALLREIALDPSFEITVAAPSCFQGDLRPLRLDPEPEGSKLNVVGLNTKWSRLIHIFRYEDTALRRLIREGEFDIVHAWEEPYIYAGYQIARAVGRTSTRFCFRTAQNKVKSYPPPFRYFERAVRARAQGWIAGGVLVHQAMLKRGYPAEHGRIITLAVDTKTFHPLPLMAREAVVSELKLTPPVIGFLGRLTQAKGLDTLMRALELVGASTSWSLLLMGGGPYKGKVEAWARNCGWPERVNVKLIKHHDVPRYLGAVDMLLAPSQTTKNWREQFGRMIVEAFACGVPVIASDSGEIPYVVGNAGRILPESDAVAWAEAIKELSADPGARTTMARRGMERVRQYSVAAVAEQYRDYYRWLAERPC